MINLHFFLPLFFFISLSQKGASDPGLSTAETRSHFGSWAIVSSPLTLSHDVNNNTITNEIWDLITNEEILMINAAYEGSSGGVRCCFFFCLFYFFFFFCRLAPGSAPGSRFSFFYFFYFFNLLPPSSCFSPLQVYQSSEETVELTDAFIEADESEDVVHAPSWQYLSKPIGNNQVAVLLMNIHEIEQTLILNFSQVPQLSCAADSAADGAESETTTTMLKKCHVRDVWLHEDLGVFDGEWNGTVASHDSKFFILS